MARYPRDLIGYGANPPDAQWPGGAKIAVQFVLNYEEGGENNLLHGDQASEAFLSEIVGAAAWPGQRHWNMESMYEYSMGTEQNGSSLNLSSSTVLFENDTDLPEEQQQQQLVVEINTTMSDDETLIYVPPSDDNNATKPNQANDPQQSLLITPPEKKEKAVSVHLL